MKLFLYTGGEIGGNDKLKDMLRYFSKSDEANAVDPELSQLHSIVQKVRDNRKVGEQYMTLQEYLDNEIKRGVEQGIKEGIEKVIEKEIKQGIEQGIEQGISKMVDVLRGFDIPEEQILEKLMEKYDITEEKAQLYLN